MRASCKLFYALVSPATPPSNTNISTSKGVILRFFCGIFYKVIMISGIHGWCFHFFPSIQIFTTPIQTRVPSTTTLVITVSKGPRFGQYLDSVGNWSWKCREAESVNSDVFTQNCMFCVNTKRSFVWMQSYWREMLSRCLLSKLFSYPNYFPVVVRIKYWQVVVSNINFDPSPPIQRGIVRQSRKA